LEHAMWREEGSKRQRDYIHNSGHCRCLVKVYYLDEHWLRRAKLVKIKLFEVTQKLCELTSGMSEMCSSPTCSHLVTMDSVFHSCTCIAQHCCTNGQIRAYSSGQTVVNRIAGSFLCNSN
jgi:hypothetical protein